MTRNRPNMTPMDQWRTATNAEHEGGEAGTDPVGPHEGARDADHYQHHVDVEQVWQRHLARADLVHALGPGQDGRHRRRISPPSPLQAPESPTDPA